MKRIGILSDTHGTWDDRYAKYFADCDEIWHAGDIGHYEIIEKLKLVAPVVRAVRGNVDNGAVVRNCPVSMLFDVEGVKVFLIHIGGYPGRYAPGIWKIIKDNRVRLMVDGHSHILKVMHDRDLDCLHINPGAAGYYGWHKQRTLIRFVIDGADMRDLEVIEMARTKIEKSEERSEKR